MKVIKPNANFILIYLFLTWTELDNCCIFTEFLKDVEIQKTETPERKAESKKTVNKVFDFAGEKISVTQDVNSKTNSISNGSSNSNNLNHTSSSHSSIIADEGIPSPSSSVESSSTSSSSASIVNNSFKTSHALPGRPRPRTKGGISFLSGDPAKIGLAGNNGKKGGGGLQAVLNAIKADKKQKMSTLEKSRLDWQSFKKDEGIEEELHNQVKSKDG